METVLGAGILFLLVIIAAGVLLKQSHYDKTQFLPPATHHASEHPSAIAAATSTFGEVAGFSPMGAPEYFGPDNLSDKIDGKAELYLERGFVSLSCQRYVDPKSQSRWFETFVFDMGEPRNAFAVYTNQRRADARDSDAAPLAYSTPNALFFSHGKYYVEMLAAETDKAIAQSMAAAAGSFISSHAGKDVQLSAAALLPTEGLHKSSIQLMLRDAFGFEKFDDFISADYNVRGTTTTAFLSVRKGANEATALVHAYHKQLTAELGGDNVETSQTIIPNLRMANMLGDFEIVFSRGNVVAGVHAAKVREAGEGLAQLLDRTIQERAQAK